MRIFRQPGILCIPLVMCAALFGDLSQGLCGHRGSAPVLTGESMVHSGGMEAPAPYHEACHPAMGRPLEHFGHVPGIHPPPPLIPPRNVLLDLGATGAQIEALEDLEFAHRGKEIDLRAQAEQAELALDRLMRAFEVKDESVMKAVDALNQVRGELFKLEVSTRLAVRRILGETLAGKLRDGYPPPPLPPPPPQGQPRPDRQ